jgi:hypothetical protein
MNKKGNFRTRQGVMRATSKSLTGPYTVEYRHLQKPGQYPVEGSSVFPLINSDEFILMYDCYANGFYQFCKGDLKNFTYVKDTPTRGTFTPRHGSVMHITKAERERLEAWSDLNLAISRVMRVPVTHISNEQIEARKTLVEKANKVLATKSNAKDFRSMQKKLEKMIQ